jgi:Arc/MetJ family transcription regulator
MYSIELDEQLVKKAMSVSGEKTQRDTVLAALHDFIKAHNRRKMLDYQGKGIWEGNLDEMRETR